LNDLAVTPITAIRPNAPALTGTANFSWHNTRSWIVEPQLQYKFQVSDAKFEVLLGSTIHQNQQDGLRINGTGYTDDNLLENLAGAATIAKGNIYSTLYKYNAAFARIKYNWQDKYIIHLTGRRDGSSRFGPENQFHNFGAAGLAWLFSNEEFIRQSLPFLSFGKIRLSYGTTGNDQVGDYRFMDTYAGNTNSYSMPYQNGLAIYPDNLYTPDLAWEVNKKAEAGLEFGFANDRYWFSASYFRNRSSNQLVFTPLPDITGFTSFATNLPALVQNDGWEFMFRTFNIKTKDFSWVSNFNFTMQKNKLLEFPGLETSTYANRFIIGQPLAVQQMYNIIGVNPNTGAYSFITAKGDTTSAPQASGVTDRYVHLNIDPKYFGGFQNTFTYKNFELDVFVQFVKQMQRNPAFLSAAAQPGLFTRGAIYGQPAEILESRWQKPGDVATYQRFTKAATGDAVTAYAAAFNSPMGWVDGSFIRIKNASLSYRLPEVWVKQMRLQNVRVYVQGQNLFTFTKYKGIDPETGINTFPPLRVLTGGIQVNL
jgi:TonB-linked SusC/RagA family outer membrane protein